MSTKLEGVLDYPDPNKSDLASPEFNAIWGVIKTWDISTHDPEGGKRMYTGAMGNHVMAILQAIGWNAYDKELPPDNIEVLAFSPDWVDEDYNEQGIRVGYLNGDEVFYSAKWCGTHDTWHEDETKPSHWKLRPTPPTP